MIDPKLLRTELDTVAEKLAKRGYELDKAFWQQVEEQRKSIQVKPRNYKPKKMRAPNKSA